MLPATPSNFYRRILTRYFRRRGKKMLSGVLVHGLAHLADWNRERSPETPLILVANHSSWWDAVMPILISLDRLNHDAFGVMEERQLQRYGFFRKLGMFSIDRDNGRSAYRSLEYAADLLRDTGRVLWFFPQGMILPNDQRPIQSFSGTAHIVQMIGRCDVAPVAFRYELLHHERPTAFAKISPPISFNGEERLSKADLNNQITQMLTETVNQLRDEVVAEELDGYEMVLEGKKSIDERWDEVRSNSKGKIKS
ncbi:MAG: lysophospholipid acyltransferase family protein [Candidatus Kapaibacterium sp.]